MTSVPRHRRKRKIRRSGRHTTPSQAEKVAQKAGKAAPALAVVGALAAGPQVHEFGQSRPAAAATQVIDARLDAAISPSHAASRAGRTYTVRPGDTLSAIAERFYGRAGDWRWLYHANRSKIHDPDLIYVGQVLRVPRDPPATFTAHHTHPHGHHGDHRDYRPRHAKHGGHHGTGLHGTLGCGGLEHLWREAGGAPRAAVTAASIAMAESGGHQYATGAAGERGYWQIHPVNGALSTYNAYGNARAAVIMSHDGTNWSPWTTWTSGAYRGRC